jgi:hypothetical protein
MARARDHYCLSSELLRRELSWTREDPVLGYQLWAGPYSAPGRGVLMTRIDPAADGSGLARHWTLTDLAAELHLTPGHLVRLFNAATGLPPMAYLAQLRAGVSVPFRAVLAGSGQAC